MVKRFALIAFVAAAANSLVGCVAIPIIALNEVIGQVDRAREAAFSPEPTADEHVAQWTD